VMAILADPSQSQRPLADVARLVLGKIGAVLVALGALVSFYGYLSAKILGVPRVTFALAETGDIPRVFGAIHERYRTPYVSIFVFAVLIWMLAFMRGFYWNVTLSAVARLLYYGVGCAALPVLRKKQPEAALFRLPGGPVLAILGLLICVVLLSEVDRSQSQILIATVAVSFINWLVVRGRPRSQAPAP
jgi:basic amino acid/polyamine antiporter, APA family